MVGAAAGSADGLGGFVGGGHALCRARSRSANGLDAGPNAPLPPPRQQQQQQRRARFSSRERALILEFVQEASSPAVAAAAAPAMGATTARGAGTGAGTGGGAGISSSAHASGTETGAESSDGGGSWFASVHNRAGSSRWVESF
ncbi:unnamed protein product, partial [Pylaiella littoralis]